jgi:predicted aspartyl protease
VLSGARSPFLLCLCSFGLTLGPNRLPAQEIAAHSIGEGLLVAPVSLNGQGPFDFVVDTGTNTTLIDPALVARLGLVEEGAENLKTLTGPTAVLRYRLASIQVGSRAVHNLPVLAQSMAAVQGLDAHINGILGLGFLARFSFELDYEHNRIFLSDGAKPLVTGGGIRVTARISQDRLLVRANSEAALHHWWNLALDSGVSKTLIFADRMSSPTESQCAGVSAPEPPCAVEDKTAIRISTNRSDRLGEAVELDAINLGGLRLRKIPAVILSPADSTEASVEDGLLPTCLFRRVAFDRANSSLLIVPK